MDNRQKTQKAALSAYLVLTARDGDRQALSGLVRLHGPRLHSHAVRLLNDGEGARDCVQDAWVEIVRGLPGLRDASAF
jgi:DNA-directed RNA polymerase specialized sigma24 family protein